MKNCVRHTYYSLFTLDEGYFKRGEDFTNERDAHEYAEEKDLSEYAILPVFERETIEVGASPAVVDRKSIPTGGPVDRKKSLTKKSKENE
jgi:hypothetical protein